MSDSLASTVALKIFQEAVNCLLGQEKIDTFASLPDDRSKEQINKAIARAKKLLNWSDNAEIRALKVIFNQITLSSQQQQPIHYWRPDAIADEKPCILYPQSDRPTSKKITAYLDRVAKEVQPILEDRKNWDNLSLLSLIIEKYSSFISLGAENLAFVDLVRSTAAVAAALAENPEASQLSLVVGDLSGVQKFIYTISSAGALKSLRARSFYLELVTEEIVQQLLKELELPSTNVIFAGASKLYILAAATEQTNQIVKKISKKFNNWLLKEFQGKVFLALDNWNFNTNKISTHEFASEWSKANKNLDRQRSQKFRHQLEDLLNPQLAYEPCKVCHRDDVKHLKKLGDDSDVDACCICTRLYRLGKQLKDVKALVRSSNKELSKVQAENGNFTYRYLKFGLSQQKTCYYHLFDDIEKAKEKVDKDKLFLVNNWHLNDYTGLDVTPLLLGNYSQKSKDDPKAFASAEELADASQGIKRVGYVRMDVDNLGQIFARGLKEKQTLPQIAGLSRQMTYFFKVYLNSLAEKRDLNFPQAENYTKVELSDDNNRPNLLFIYAGGDDLFISGAWNEIVEFSFDIYQCFRAYTGNNPDITISAGISLAVPKFPLYQAADESGDAEETAKGNGKDSLTLFGETFKWDEWLGNKNLSIDTVKAKDKEYWETIKIKPTQPELLGVVPIVEKLTSLEIGQDYARNFVRNLINTSNLQRQKLKEIEEKGKTINYEYEEKDIKYYLHLPQIAYTLARLPKKVLDDDDFRKALKNPYNAPYYRAIATWIELLNRQSNATS